MTTDPAPHRVGLPRAAAAVAATAWGCAVLAVVLVVVARPPLGEGLWFFVVDVAVAAVYGTVAALILARRPHAVGWLLALAAVGGGLAALGFGYPALAELRPGLPGVAVVEWLQATAWVPGTLALFLVVPWLVRDHRLGRAVWGVVAGAALVVGILAAQLLELYPVFVGLLVAAVVVGLVAAAAVEHRHLRGPVEERNGLGWLALGAAILALSFVPLVLPPDGPVTVPLWTTSALHLVSQAVYPAAILVAVLRSRMWGLRLVVSRTVLAGLLTVSLAAVYVVVTVVATRLVPGEGAAGLVGAAVVAVAVQPARLWLDRRVHRLVYGAAASPDHVVRRLGSHLRLAETADDLLHGLAADVGTAMRLESVAVVLPGRPPVIWGTPGERPLVTPLAHRGEHVGELEVTLPGGESLGTRGEQTLADLATVVATAAAVTRAAEEVDEARTRLARARLEERRVIRREIHDGLGPSLAGLRLGLQGARNLMASDPASAAALLATLQAELDQRVDDVRSLSHSLLPPVLDELGLAAALAELAARHAEDGVEVRLDLHHDDVLDTQVAAAAYGIASEAVTNAVRHSGMRSCTVTTATTESGLVVRVADEGHGIAEDARSGVGTRSMRERAEEQGGVLDLRSAPGVGTTVEAVLPVGAGARV
ncbi:histidine kinase [Oryzobacter terrae]|uniref:sensor histidine kinase n=1 Tax=Oryzobacter terrae TaxID=1620385 RepID=UPI003672F3E5